MSDLQPPLAPPDDLLAELAGLLERQVQLAQQGQYEQLAALSARARELMARAAGLGQDGQSDPAQAAHHRRQLDRLRTLHRRLALILADQQRQFVDQLGQLRRGTSALGAYKQAGSD